MAKRNGRRDSGSIFVFRIGIEYAEPKIWRKLRVPGYFTLAEFHTAIQIAFGWTDSHLHSFTIDSVDYMPESEDDGGWDDLGDVQSEDGCRLDDLGLREKQNFRYTYDFGDSWQHKITVSKIIPFQEEEEPPLCLGGKYACPLEDSGGTDGYAEILEILQNPRHKDYQEFREWAGDHDPLAFDLDEVNQILRKVFPPARKAKAGKTKAASGESASGKGKEPPEPSAAGKQGQGSYQVPDEKLLALYALTARIKEIKPWEKFYDTEFILIHFPDRTEPVLCSIIGREKQSFGILVYPGFASILSLFRLNNEDAEMGNPFTMLGYQNFFSCQLGRRDELFSDERTRLKDLGISFRGKNDWVFFRKSMPGRLPWYINAAEADLLIQVLTRLIEACVCFEEGGVSVDFDDEVLACRYSKKDKKWVIGAEKMPSVPVEMDEYRVDTGEVEPLRFKKQTGAAVEAETLFIPRIAGTDKEGVPVFIRITVLLDNETGAVLAQRVLPPDEDGNAALLNLLVDHIKTHGRPGTVMVRDEFTAAVLQDFCGKVNINMNYAKGMPMVDGFIRTGLSFLTP
jgi:hypothetical protein